MGAAEEKGKYEIFSVEGTTNERYLVLWVRENFFTSTTSTPRGTTLANFMSTEDIYKGDAITQGWGNYILTDVLPKTNGCLRFVFHLDKTVSQIATPIRTPYEIVIPVEWPDWLFTLYAVSGTVAEETETGLTGATSTSNTVTRSKVFDRFILYKGGRFQTTALVEEFFSPTPFTDIYATEPRPMPVYYNYLGMKNSLVCLHEEVRVKELLTTATLIEEFGTANIQEVKWREGTVFPATNMTGWTSYIGKDEVIERDGGFYRRRETYFPPELPEPIED